MEDIDSSPLVANSPNTRKRAAPDDDSPENRRLNLKGDQFMMPTPPDTEESSNASPSNEADPNKRAGSPALSTISTLSSTIDVSSANAAQQNTSSGSKPPPAKRRKLTSAEKIVQAHEKEEKQKQKAEDKARKEEEKAMKDEERAKKDKEKRRKAEEREFKKREKELEEERKVQEKLNKERKQMRLGAFFQKPATPVRSPGPNTTGEAWTGHVRRKSLPLEPYADQARRSASPLKGTPLQLKPQPAVSAVKTEETSASTVPDYKKAFLPFEPPSHSYVAEIFTVQNPDDLAYWQGMFESELRDPGLQEKIDLGIIQPGSTFETINHLFCSESSRGLHVPDLRALIDQIQGTSQQPVDLTNNLARSPMQALQTLPRRHLQFEQDVRPPWFGTYTKIRSPRASRKLSRNPFTRARPDTDYDYDSEAEWEEPGNDDEDIDLDEDDEAESLGDVDEMDGFLDDDDDAAKSKHKLITGDLQPSSTGLCWENDAGKIMPSIESEQSRREMHGMRIGFLIPGFTGMTIDPFSTAYWTNEMAPPGAPIVELDSKALGRTATPSRSPLADRPNANGTLSQGLVGAAQDLKGPITSVTVAQSAKRGPKPQPKALSKEDLDEFKEAVVGSPLGKLELSKGLKLRFPKITNDAIKDALGSHFAQIGTTKAERKWVYVGPQ